jgi:hypothetical protein
MTALVDDALHHRAPRSAWRNGIVCPFEHMRDRKRPLTVLRQHHSAAVLATRHDATDRVPPRSDHILVADPSYPKPLSP